ncbi:MAG: response regulator [Nitrospirota bacterium]|nr:response regulator [Nitrospirota bacterium]
MSRPFTRLLILVFVAWTAVCVGSLFYHLSDDERHIYQLANSVASERIATDQLYRFWAAGHGGVYVPVTETTPPNPFLKNVKERDIIAPSGRRLTLVNPAYMTRQVHELGRTRGVIKGHIFSDRPIRPENAPDEWEKEGLAVLADGKQSEFGQVVMLDGELHYRLIKPLYIEQPCLSCHAAQGYKLGDLRGGLSAAIPLASFRSMERQHLLNGYKHFGTVWLFGCIGLAVAAPYVKRRIREREDATRKMEESEMRFRAIFEGAPDAILLADPETGTLVDANHAAESLLQRTRSELIGLHQSQLHPPEEEDNGRAVFAQHVKQEVSAPTEHNILRKDGTKIPVQIGATVMTLAGRRAIMGVFRDMSRMKQAEEQKEQLEAQLVQSQKIESVGQLAGGIAHDINNMLTPILGYADMLSIGLPAGDPKHVNVKEIVNAANRVKDMSHQLLAFARKQTLEMRPVDLNVVITGFSKMLRRALPESITIKMDLAPSIGTVFADERQFELVILNLAVNARDAMPKGGLLKILTRDAVVAREKTLSRMTICPGRYVLIKVDDIGMGMDSATMSRIFEPFFTTKESGQGTGLGLATVYGIVKQHNGFIDVASEPRQGTTFSLYFPIVEDTIDHGAVAPVRTLLRGSETVLLVEDQPDVLRSVQQLLETLGYRVLTAGNGNAALDVLQGDGASIDILISDVIMPGMNGRELYEILRQTHPAIKVLFLSGYSADVISTHGVLDKGMNVLRKPFSIQDLSEKVRQVLDERRS